VNSLIYVSSIFQNAKPESSHSKPHFAPPQDHILHPSFILQSLQEIEKQLAQVVIKMEHDENA